MCSVSRREPKLTLKEAGAPVHNCNWCIKCAKSNKQGENGWGEGGKTLTMQNLCYTIQWEMWQFSGTAKTNQKPFFFSCDFEWQKPQCLDKSHYLLFRYGKKPELILWSLRFASLPPASPDCFVLKVSCGLFCIFFFLD